MKMMRKFVKSNVMMMTLAKRKVSKFPKIFSFAVLWKSDVGGKSQWIVEGENALPRRLLNSLTSLALVVHSASHPYNSRARRWHKRTKDALLDTVANWLLLIPFNSRPMTSDPIKGLSLHIKIREFRFFLPWNMRMESKFLCNRSR